MLLVVFAEIGFRNGDVHADFLAYHAVYQEFVGHLLLIFLERYTGLFADVVVELFRVGDLTENLQFEQATRHFTVHVDL